MNWVEVLFYFPQIPPQSPRDYFAMFWWGVGLIILFYNIYPMFSYYINPHKEQRAKKISKKKMDKWLRYK